MKRAFSKSRTPTNRARIRTRDLRFTKPLLYQLSYVGAGWKIASDSYTSKRRSEVDECDARRAPLQFQAPAAASQMIATFRVFAKEKLDIYLAALVALAYLRAGAGPKETMRTPLTT